MNTNLSARRPAALSRSPFRSPFAGLFPREWVDDMFDQFLIPAGNGQVAEMMNAAMDVSETDNAFEIKMDLPGVNADDVDIQLENNTLTVRGQRNEEKEELDKGRQYHRLERFSGSFARSLVLPSAINEDETAAEFREGVLKITIPKTEDSRPRKISVKT